MYAIVLYSKLSMSLGDELKLQIHNKANAWMVIINSNPTTKIILDILL
jgi:hypothetical protein